MTDLLPQVANTLALAALSFALAISLGLVVGLLAFRHRFIALLVKFFGAIPWFITLALVLIVGGRKVHPGVVYEWLLVALPLASALVLPAARLVLAARSSIVEQSYRDWGRTIGRRSVSIFFKDTLPAMRSQLFKNLSGLLPSAVVGAVALAWLGYTLPKNTPDLSLWIQAHLSIERVAVEDVTQQLWSLLALSIGLGVLIIVSFSIRRWRMRTLSSSTRAIAARAAGMSPWQVRRSWLTHLEPRADALMVAQAAWWLALVLEISLQWPGVIVAGVHPLQLLEREETLKWCAQNVGIWLVLVVLISLVRAIRNRRLV